MKLVFVSIFLMVVNVGISALADPPSLENCANNLGSIYSDTKVSGLQAEVEAKGKALSAATREGDPETIIKTTKDLYQLQIQLANAINTQEDSRYFQYPMIEHYQYRIHKPTNSGARIKEEDIEKYRVTVKKGKLYQGDKVLDTEGDSWVVVLSDRGMFAGRETNLGDGLLKHSTLSLGQNVYFAGEFKVRNGKVKKVKNSSGRYRTLPFFVKQFVRYLNDQGLKTKDIEEKIYLKLTNILSPSQYAFLISLGVEPTEELAEAKSRGNDYLQEILLGLQGVNEDTDFEEVYDWQDFLILAGDLGDLKRPMTNATIDVLLNTNISPSEIKDYIYEFHRLYRDMDQELMLERLKEIREAYSGRNTPFEDAVCDYLDKRFFNKINKVFH